MSPKCISPLQTLQKRGGAIQRGKPDPGSEPGMTRSGTHRIAAPLRSSHCGFAPRGWIARTKATSCQVLAYRNDCGFVHRGWIARTKATSCQVLAYRNDCGFAPRGWIARTKATSCQVLAHRTASGKERSELPIHYAFPPTALCPS